MAAGVNSSDPLAGLRAYHLPDSPSWWPPAPGWWALLVILIVAGLFFAWWFARRRSRGAAARQVLRELAGLRERADRDGESPDLLRELSRLLRRFAIAIYPRQDVAALTGDAWLQFLDRHGGAGSFQQGPGRQLAEAPYRAEPATGFDELLALVEDWVQHNQKHFREAQR